MTNFKKFLASCKEDFKNQIEERLHDDVAMRFDGIVLELSVQDSENYNALFRREYRVRDQEKWFEKSISNKSSR